MLVAPPSSWDSSLQRESYVSEQKVKTPALDNEGGYQTVTDAIKLIVHGQKASRNDVIACGLDIPGPVADDGTVWSSRQM